MRAQAPEAHSTARQRRVAPPFAPALWRRLTAAVAIGLCSGGAGLVFGRALVEVTASREQWGLLCLGLPLFGGLAGLIANSPLGQDLGMSSLFARLEGSARRTAKQAPYLIGLTALLTHLGGGSAGREGAAVQIGAATADVALTPFAHGPSERVAWLLAGMAAGFAAVFGTPLAAVLFALEVGPRRRRMRSDLPVMAIAAAVAYLLRAPVGLVASPGLALPALALGGPTGAHLALGCLVLALTLGAVARGFVSALAAVRVAFQRSLPYAPARPVLGGLIVALAFPPGGPRGFVLGLGEDTLWRAVAGDVFSLAVPGWKLLATLITIGSGFFGGEVTPLFFAGATLGSAMAAPLGLPPGIAAAIGLGSLFAAGAKVPVSLAVMVAELCGAPILLPAIACNVAACFVTRGAKSIYGPTENDFGGLISAIAAVFK